MKKTVRLICVCLSLLAVALSFASCGRKLKIDVKTAKIYDTKSGIRYEYVPANFVPKGVGTDVFATFEQNKVTVDYYEVEGLPAEEWLYSELGELICSTGVDALPDFAGFGAKSVTVCYNTDLNFTFAEIGDPEQAKAVAERFVSGPEVQPDVYDHDTYKLLFSSDGYPALYYQLWLIVTEEGSFIYDRFTGKYAEATDLFSDIVPAFSYEVHD
ncbi:MAG: hypothetical protein ILO42_09590 [Clostridia bacterium]|nr:hypothetical protein [Clostridia bacterium]MBP5271195.1 hypothetical protein [Clostridia bacterium]